MADQIPNSSTLTASASLAPKTENITSANPIADLEESRIELLNRIQNLKQDLQSWRSKLDTQVKVYREELTDLKKTLNIEIEQIHMEFKDMKNAIHQLQEEGTVTVNNLGLLQDELGNPKELKNEKDEAKEDKEAED